MINTNIKILIVEDDNTERLLLKHFLEKFNIEKILESDNGKNAIEIFKDNPDVNLILMNIGMPIMDGNIATEEIRKFDKDVIIIAHTSYASFDETKKIMEYGFTDFLKKPILLNDLYKIIEKYFFI